MDSDTYQAFIEEQLKKYQKQVDRALEEHYINNEGAFSPAVEITQQDLVSRLKEFNTRPSKHIRGVIARATYEMLGGENKRTADVVSVVIELVQDYLLIIDDVMDRSEIRRGERTVHRQYIEDLLKKTKDRAEAEHLGEMVAINAGLMVAHIASGMLLELDEKADSIVAASKYFHRNIQRTVLGQVEDLFNNQFGDFDEQRILKLQRLKSGYYTVVNPMQVSAALSGKEDVDMEAIEKFGVFAGSAFQLHDDFIGMFGDERKTGKKNTDDIKEGKMTLLIHHALKHADNTEKEFIKASLGNPELSEADAGRVRDIVKSTGSLKYTKQLIDENVSRALEELESSDFPQDLKDFMKQLLQYAVKRES